jgi:hypothetical protein
MEKRSAVDKNLNYSIPAITLQSRNIIEGMVLALQNGNEKRQAEAAKCRRNLSGEDAKMGGRPSTAETRTTQRKQRVTRKSRYNLEKFDVSYADAPPLSPTNPGKMSKNSIPGHEHSLAVRVPLCRHRPYQIPPHFKFFQLLRLFLFLALDQEAMIRIVKF